MELEQIEELSGAINQVNDTLRELRDTSWPMDGNFASLIDTLKKKINGLDVPEDVDVEGDVAEIKETIEELQHLAGRLQNITSIPPIQVQNSSGGIAIGFDEEFQPQAAQDETGFWAKIENEASGGGGEYDQWVEQDIDGDGDFTDKTTDQRDETTTGESLYEANDTEDIPTGTYVWVERKHDADGDARYYFEYQDKTSGGGSTWYKHKLYLNQGPSTSGEKVTAIDKNLKGHTVMWQGAEIDAEPGTWASGETFQVDTLPSSGLPVVLWSTGEPNADPDDVDLILDTDGKIKWDIPANNNCFDTLTWYFEVTLLDIGDTPDDEFNGS